MHTTTAENTRPRATFRQWETVTRDRMDGAVVQVRRHTVALYRSPLTGEALGILDGKTVPVRKVLDILTDPDTRATVTAEKLEQRPERIGKAAAYELHKELGRLRFRDHYTAASEALGFPVSSLAALTAEEAHTVRSYARGQWGMSA